MRAKCFRCLFAAIFLVFVFCATSIVLADTASGRDGATVLAAADTRIITSAEDKEMSETDRLLSRARDYLSRGRFDSARKLVKKALEIDPVNTEAQNLLKYIGISEEKAQKAEEADRIAREKARQEAEAKRQAELEAKRKAQSAKQEELRKTREAERAAKEQARQEQAAQAQAELEARKKAEEAARLAEEQVKQEEAAQRQAEEEARRKAEEEERIAKEKAQQEQEAQKKAEQVAKDRAKAEKEQARIANKVKKLALRARAFLLKGKYSDARKYAYQAREENPADEEVAGLITDIDKEEMFGRTVGATDRRLQKGEKAAQKWEQQEDIFHRYDEGKAWYEYVTGMFKKKKQPMDEVQDERTYNIDECVELAVQRSQRRVMVDNQVKLAEMRVWESRRELFPEVSAKLEMSTGKIHSDNYFRHYKGQKWSIDVEQTAFDGMGKWFELRQAQANLKVTKLEKEKVLGEIIEDTKEAYYNLDKAVKALDIQERRKDTVSGFYDITDKAYQQELVSKVEFLKVKAQHLTADFQYTSAEEDLSLAEMILFQNLNMEPDQRIKIEPVERPQDRPSVGLENCYRLALANNPEFQGKAAMIEYYNLERKIMKSKGWPEIEFTGSFGQMMEKYEPMFLPGDWRTPQAGGEGTGGVARALIGWEPEWYAGVKGSVPLWGNTLEYNYVREHWAPTVSAFRGSESATSYFTFKFLDDLAYFSNLQEARAGFESAKYEYLKAKKDLLVEVKELYFKYRKALLNMDVAQSHYEHQKKYVDVLEERRNFGEMEMSKLVEEYDKLAEYEYGILQGDADFFISLAELSTAIGIPDYFKPVYEKKGYKTWEENREAWLESQRQAAQKARARKGPEKEVDLIALARSELDRKEFGRARSYAQKAFDLDYSEEAAKLLAEIDAAEDAHKK